MSDLYFFGAIGGVCAQIVMLFAFYYAVFRRLFCPPEANNFLPTLLFFLLFKLGYPIVFILGWVKSRSKGTARVMTFWSLAMLATGGCCVSLYFLENKSLALQAIVSIFWTSIVAALSIVSLRPHFRLDDRIRTLVRNPTDANVHRILALGNSAVPELRLLLDDPYGPTREAAVRCLCGIGPVALPILERLLNDEDSRVRSNAAEAIERFKNESK